MKPVAMNATNIAGKFAAGGQIPFGAVCERTAAGEVKATTTGTRYDYIGVAVDDNLTKDVDGFYSDGNNVPLVTSGVCRVWMLGGVESLSGDFIIFAGALGAGSEQLGVCTEESTATTRTAASIGRIIGDDVGSTDDTQVLSADAASGQKTLTLLAAAVTAIGLSVGDYIIIADSSTAEVNRVAATTSTTITLQNNTVNAYTTAATATVYKLVQADVELM